MKRKLIVALTLACVFIMAFGTVASAFSPYETYTYTSNGDGVRSPDAYTAPEGSVHTAITMSENSKIQISSEKENIFTGEYNEDGSEKTVSAGSTYVDLCTDERGWIYLSDNEKNRIVVLNQYYKAEMVIDRFTSDKGPNDTLKSPQGVFATDKYLFVCDTGNKRIVMFNTADGTYHKTINAPASKVLDSTEFTPIACAYDRFGKLFVVSSTTSKGVIVMDDNGVFTGYIGAKKVTVNAFDQFFRRFKSEEERAEDLKNVGTNLKNIALEHGDYGDFLYVVAAKPTTSESINQQIASIDSKDADYSPIRKLNAKGDEIMKRNGFFDCGGEINIKAYSKGSASTSGISWIEDVAVGPQTAGAWSIIDNKRSKVFTYDNMGQLLFVFGDKNSTNNDQMGSIENLVAIDYQYDAENDSYNILLLDKTNDRFTTYACTEYGELLFDALENDNERNYSKSIDYWLQILEANNNFDAAYIGVGKAYYNSGEYDKALEYLEAAHETTVYAQTLSAQSQDRISSNVWIPIGIVLLVGIGIFLVVKFFGYAKRVNYEGNFKKKHTYWEELMYAFYVIFHPFDGFWDIKHEQRGTVRGGLTILGINILAFYYQTIGRSYLANPNGNYSAFWTQIAAVALPVVLWSVSNWCLTTLFDGEAKFKHVFVTACYSLTPLPIFVVAGTVITNLSNTTGDSIVTLVTTIGYIWVAYLLFFGTLTVQDYSLGKNVITTIGTILGMAVIMFVVILFADLVGDMVGFVSNLATEISYRT